MLGLNEIDFLRNTNFSKLIEQKWKYIEEISPLQGEYSK